MLRKIRSAVLVILEGVLVSVFVFAIAYGAIGLTAYLVFSFVVVDVVSPSTVTEGVLSLALVLILLMVPLGMYGFYQVVPQSRVPWMHRSRDAAVIATGLTTSTSFMMLFAISVDDLSSDRVASVAAEVLGGLVTVGALLGMALLARPSPGRYEHKQRSSLQVEDD